MLSNNNIPKKIDPKFELPRYRFIVTTLITFSVLLFSFIMIGKTQTDDPTFSIWVGFITYILGYYTPSPKEYSKKKRQINNEHHPISIENPVENIQPMEQPMEQQMEEIVVE